MSPVINAGITGDMNFCIELVFLSNSKSLGRFLFFSAGMLEIIVRDAFGHDLVSIRQPEDCRKKRFLLSNSGNPVAMNGKRANVPGLANQEEP